MHTLARYITLIIGAAGVAFAVVALYFVAYVLLVEGEPSLFLSHATAFTAAFIGFLFSWLSFWVSRLTDRLAKHRNATVFYEHYLSRHLDTIQRYKRHCETAAGALQKHRFFFFADFRFEFPGDRLAELLDLILVNKLQDIGIDIWTANTDYHTMRTSYLSLTNDLKQKLIPSEDYWDNVGRLADELQALAVFCARVDEKMVDCITRCQYQLAIGKPYYVQILQSPLFIRRYKQDALERVYKKVVTGRKEVAEESKARLKAQGLYTEPPAGRGSGP